MHGCYNQFHKNLQFKYVIIEIMYFETPASLVSPVWLIRKNIHYSNIMLPNAIYSMFENFVEQQKINIPFFVRLVYFIYFLFIEKS